MPATHNIHGYSNQFSNKWLTCHSNTSPASCLCIRNSDKWFHNQKH